jgi:ATP-binding cassette subfamily B protein
MMSFARPYQRPLIVFLIVVVLSAVAGAVNPLLVRILIDNGIVSKDSRVIIEVSVLMAVLSVFGLALTSTQRRIATYISQHLVYDLRALMFRHIQRLPIAFFNRTQTGALVSRMNNDVVGAQAAFTDLLANVVSNLITVMVALGAMLYLSWPITVAVLVLFPAFLVPARVVARRMGTLNIEGYNRYSQLNMAMQEQFSAPGALQVKLFGTPETDASSFERTASQLRDIGVKRATYGRVFFVALSLIASLATAAVYGIGGVAAVHGALQLGTVVALTAYLTRIYGPLTQLSSLNLDVVACLVSFERIFEVLDLTPNIREDPNGVEMPGGNPSIHFENVSFSYPLPSEVSLASLEAVTALEADTPVEVLHGISFVVEPGRMVALVGPSGAGKTTISSLIPRLYDTTAGTVRLNGIDVRQLTAQSLRDSVGMVSQDPYLFHDTLRGNLAYGCPEATESEILSALAAAQLAHLVNELPNGLDTVVGERGYRLSGGERQRVALAQLMLKAPEIVVLDEATAHLDSRTEAAVQRALQVVMNGRTSLVIAHRLSTVRAADLLLVIDEGRVVERGTHAELMAKGGLYFRLHATQQFGDTGIAEPET